MSSPPFPFLNGHEYRDKMYLDMNIEIEMDIEMGMERMKIRRQYL